MLKARKPNFIIIGAAKCGTTALASILNNHPDCCMSNPKEVSFFQDTIDFQPNPNYEKGWEWYQRAFAHYNGEPVVGEATPSYSDRSRSPNTAKRVYEFNPNMKIIYMVREPLQRQISGWQMQWVEGMNGTWPDRIETKWALKGFDYWMRMQMDVKQWDYCRYRYQLEAYEKYFPAENICVSFLEDWKQSKESEIKRIMIFLGLDPDRWQTDILENSNRGADRRIDRPSLKKIRMIPQVKAIVQYFPISWREWARHEIGKAQPNYPKPQLTDDTQREFITYILDDAQVFLRKHGKELELWPEVTHSNHVAHSKK